VPGLGLLFCCRTCVRYAAAGAAGFAGSEVRVNWPPDVGIKPYYSDDRVVIFNADCRDVLPLLPKCDLLLTDPPYGISLSNHARGKERADFDWTIRGDDTQELGQTVLNEFLNQPTIAFASPMKPWLGQWRQHLAWEKGEHVSGGGDPFVCWKPSWELLQVRNNRELNGGRDGAVLRFPAIKDDYRLHPSPKPVALMEYLIWKATNENGVVIDTFAGACPTAVAAKKLNRNCIAIEVEERYCEIGAQRCRQGVLW
jgi:site-specific DNA-methyltransferase (adenine-specific)